MALDERKVDDWFASILIPIILFTHMFVFSTKLSLIYCRVFVEFE